MSDTLQRLTSALGDRYALEREIGAGGMATVFLARDLRHGRPVAIKVVRPELSGADGIARFLREIELAARLQHPNILPVFDSGAIDDGSGGRTPYFVMPFVQGETVRARLGREPAGAVGRILIRIVGVGHLASNARGPATDRVESIGGSHRCRVVRFA